MTSRDDLAGWKARLEQAMKKTPAYVPQCATCGDAKHLDDPCYVRRPCPKCNYRNAHDVPGEYRGVAIANLQPRLGQQTAIEHAKAFMDHKRDLMLTGPVGTGKTILAIAIANAYVNLASYHAAWFVRWPFVVNQLQPGNLDDGERQKLQWNLFNVQLLVVDDLGCERDLASDFTRRMAYLVYEKRGDAGLRTVVTSNLDLDELARHQGDDRLTSRLAARADVVLVSGRDHRLPRARETERRRA
jgi:DNA replication protein DnaC